MNASGQNVSKATKCNQNVQVYLRVRPTNSRERLIKSQEIVDVVSSREVLLKPSLTFLDSRTNKKFLFDRAFGINSKQHEIYHSVVAPYIDEVLSGFNCTVFAYGQTGTGKTYTMVGEETPELSSSWEDDTQTGIIPRALNHLFEELRMKELEFSMRISYLELYNEELCDLLSTEDCSNIRIYDDGNKKGSVIVHGLEEIPVHSKDDVYKLLAKGQERRKTAATLMNAQSSRSHTIFSLIVHIKENGIEGEEMLKIGKLNLVDLAGSENISKAGNEKGIRTRETVNINQSLLTLGRVITALVERTPHIPYRESKLTRLLQESLGGRTKTSIIATVSPGHKDFEETLSTLEYAHRAKNIQNKPEANQKLSKKTVIKEYTEEIDRLKRDLMAARDKNGIYLAEDTYNDMVYKHESQTRELNEKVAICRLLKDDLAKKESIFNELTQAFVEKQEILKETEENLGSTKSELGLTKRNLSKTKRRYAEKKVILDNHMKTEEILTNQAKELINVVEKVSTDTKGLHETIERRKMIDGRNQSVCEKFVDKMMASVEEMQQDVNKLMQNSNQASGYIREDWEKFYTAQQEARENAVRKIQSLQFLSNSIMNESVDIQEKFGSNLAGWSEEHVGVVKSIVDDANRQIKEKLSNYFNESINVFETTINNENNENVQIFSRIVDQIEFSFKSSNEYFERQSEKLFEFSELISNFTVQQERLNRNIEKKKEEKAILDEVQRLLTSLSNSRTEEETNLVDISKEIGANVNKINLNIAENKKLLETQKEIGEKNSHSIENDVKVYTEKKTVQLSTNRTKLTELASGVNKNLTEIAETNSNLLETLKKERDELEAKLAQFSEDLKLHQTKSEQLVKEHYNILVDDNKRDKKVFDEFKNINTSSHKRIDSTIKEYGNSALEKLILAGEKVEKFQKEEFQVYSSTGDTPVRKNTNYPKKLVATSPHDRIVRKFWTETGMMELDNSITISEEDNSLLEVANNDSFRNSTPLQPNSRSSMDEEKKYLQNLQISNIMSRQNILEEEEDENKEN